MRSLHSGIDLLMWRFSNRKDVRGCTSPGRHISCINTPRHISTFTDHRRPILESRRMHAPQLLHLIKYMTVVQQTSIYSALYILSVAMYHKPYLPYIHSQSNSEPAFWNSRDKSSSLEALDFSWYVVCGTTYVFRMHLQAEESLQSPGGSNVFHPWDLIEDIFWNESMCSWWSIRNHCSN